MGLIDIVQNIPRYQSGDTLQFTLNTSTFAPSSADFNIYDQLGAVVPLDAVQSGYTVIASPANQMVYTRILPTTRGLYSYEWTMWDSASRTYYNRGEFEIILTKATSFFTYGDPSDIVRTARQLFGRTDITFYEMPQYCQAADGYIDAYLGAIIPVPLSPPVPELIQDMSKVYTLWRYYCDRFSQDKDQEPLGIIHRKEDYDKLLAAFAAGSLSIPGFDTTETYQVEVIEPTGLNASVKPIFDSRDFTEQKVSHDLQDFDKGRDD